MFVVAMVMGFAWFATSALSKLQYTSIERDTRSNLALKQAKDALLAYVAQNAFSTAELYPGRLPCPEPISIPRNTTTVAGTGNAAYDGKTFETVYSGYAAPFTSTTTPPANAAIACTGVGRFPWKTFGVSQILDGDDEPLWYAVATGTWAWVNSGDALTINPGTANQITFDGAPNAAVAVIIAPGAMLNTMSTGGGVPAGCVQGNQSARYSSAYTVSNFMECGNATGSYTTLPITSWSNDRTISITAREVMDAISAGVIDRMQRQVAPALADWRQTQSVAIWGTSFLPYASAFNTGPATNDYCGDVGTPEGLLPMVKAASLLTCTAWTSGTVTGLLQTLVGGASCSQNAGNTALVCSFSGFSFLGGLFKSRITAPAPRVGASFRDKITTADISVSPVGSTVDNLSVTLSTITGAATLSVDVSRNLGFLSTQPFTVTIPNLPDASILTDSRVTWFLNNQWEKYTYYAVADGATLSPTNACTNPGDSGCITVSGLPTSTGNTNDKKFVLVLMGNALNGQTQPSGTVANYLEAGNASTGDQTFVSASSSTTGSAACTITQMPTASCAFNDRIATCPFRQTPTSGTVTICN